MKDKPSQINHDLTSLLSRKIKAFEDYSAATVLLGQTLEEKDMVKIGTAVNLRENLIENITSIDLEIQKLSVGGLTYTRSGNKNVNDLLAKLEEIIRKIQDNDNRCVGSATVLHEETRDDIMFIDKGLKAFRSFNEKQSRKPRFLDIKT